MKPNDPSYDPIDVDPEYDDALSGHAVEESQDEESADLNYDDAEIYDENWEDPAEEQGTLPALKQPKKKSSFTTILLIGAALIVGGGVFMAKFAGKNTAPAVAPAQTDTQKNLIAIQDDASSPEAETPVIASKPSPSAQKGFMDDPNQLAQPGSTSPNAPVPVDTSATVSPSQTASDADISKTDQPSTALQPAPVASEAPPSITAPAPALSEAPASTSSPAASSSSVQVQQSPPVATTQAPADTAANAALQSKLDQAMQRIDTLEKKVADDAAKPAPAAVSAPAPDQSAEINSLKETISDLQSKVSVLSAQPLSRPSAPVAVPADTQSSPSPVAASAPVKPVTHKIAAKKPAAVSKPQLSASSSGWELRGVGAGEAMIGKPGQADYTTIRVGDNVPGMGPVQAIEQVNGAWSIRTANGRIAQ